MTNTETQFMIGFQKPKRLASESETATSRYSKFYAQPFERGFGTTIGNCLRRVLLSSIEGSNRADTADRLSLHGVGHSPGAYVLSS